MNLPELGFQSPAIDADEARKRLSRTSWWGRKLQPSAVELLYIPHYLYGFSISGVAREPEHAVVDAVVGEFALLSLPPSRREALPPVPGDTAPPVLDERNARELALRGLKRLLFQVGLKSGRTPSLSQLLPIGRLFLPFWLGYRERGPSFSLAAIDGLSGQVQGPRVKHMLMAAISLLEKRSSRPS